MTTPFSSVAGLYDAEAVEPFTIGSVVANLALAIRGASAVTLISAILVPQTLAVTGRPGHTGQTSCAALSQTVKTKSRAGASGLANSSHDLERNPLMSLTMVAPAASACRATAAL